MTVLVLVITVLSGLLVLGLLLLRRGLRGRRVGDHPVCGKCGFDLFGLPDDQARCPECGSDLRAHGAVQTGHRERRMRLVYAGAAVLVLFALILGTEGGKTFRQIDWQQMKPAAWLAREARSGSSVAWTELGRRARMGELSDERAQALIADALAWQKDASRTWVPAVGNYVEDARAGQLVKDADWAVYCRQAPQLSLVWRAKVRKGDPLPGRVSTGAARVGTKGGLSVRIESPIESDDPLVVQSRVVGGGGGGHSQNSMNPTGGGGSTGVYLPLDPKAVDAALLGNRTTTVKVRTEVRESWDMPGAVVWTEHLSADWQLVSADAQTIELIPDDKPQIRKQIESGLKIIRLEVRRYPGVSAGHTVSLVMTIATPPLPLSFDVFLRSGENEWKFTTISGAGATEYHTGGHLPATANFDARRVSVIFRPSPASAHHTVDITRIWNGEISIPDVEVTWSGAAPATRP
ncbi:MAG: hypothetical protein M3478_05160 [Planctomycetota bacterium]|nr:hypothetical protein [Planctomycetota bacterium]